MNAEERRKALVDVYKEASACTRCALHEGRKNVVFGAGNANADLMFVGEAPGAQEDIQGLPFVGRAGQLLNQLLEEIELSRDEVFITNILKSRPPGNRDPQPEEIEACTPYLLRQVQLIQPRVIATLGNFAHQVPHQARRPASPECGVTPQVSRHLRGARCSFFPLLPSGRRAPHSVDARHPPRGLPAPCASFSSEPVRLGFGDEVEALEPEPGSPTSDPARPVRVSGEGASADAPERLAGAHGGDRGRARGHASAR